MFGQYLTILVCAMVLVFANRLYFFWLAKIKSGDNRDIKKLILGFAQSVIYLSTIYVFVGWLENSRITGDDKYILIGVLTVIFAASTLYEIYNHYKMHKNH